MTVVLIDLSGFIYHRYFALVHWMKMNDIHDEDLHKHYTYFFENHLVRLKKTYECEWEDLYLCADCPRKNIWRMAIYADYKTARVENKIDHSIFSYTFENIIPDLQDKYKFKMKSHPCAEADDIIAVHANNHANDHKIIIVSNDNDYIQLINDRIDVVNLCGKRLIDRIPKELEKDPRLFLEWKIIKGDSSDNIPAIKKRIGDKTAIKLVLSKDSLDELLNDEVVMKQYNLNKKLISFKEIPENIYKDIVHSYIE